MNDVASKLLREHNEGVALDNHNARLAADPTFAAAVSAANRAAVAATIAQLDSIHKGGRIASLQHYFAGSAPPIEVELEVFRRWNLKRPK